MIVPRRSTVTAAADHHRQPEVLTPPAPHILVLREGLVLTPPAPHILGPRGALVLTPPAPYILGPRGTLVEALLPVMGVGRRVKPLVEVGGPLQEEGKDATTATGQEFLTSCTTDLLKNSTD